MLAAAGPAIALASPEAMPDSGTAPDETRPQPYIHLTAALASTSTISTSPSPPSLSIPSLAAVRSRSAQSISLNTPDDEVSNPMPISFGQEKLWEAYRGRFIELIEEDWEFRDEDAERDESFEIVSLPRASTSTQGTASTTESHAFKALPFIRRHGTKGSGISPSFSTSRLLASLGQKSRAIWTQREKHADSRRAPRSDTPSGAAAFDEFGVGATPLSTIGEIPSAEAPQSPLKGFGTRLGAKAGIPQDSTESFVVRRLSLRRRQR
ncbi:hypothetical protein CALCODRAFT_497635 [Calocera cornea HHB12733]|uniref:Uncharacterized protein n=1 Tax=Calocera cornea HHB12733 TaxID=1353952 RepID=A0A165F505_9BASI|nr:hypothetical protein CALCODRAFT_497635 [Calocera cornea HHB12733]